MISLPMVRTMMVKPWNMDFPSWWTANIKSGFQAGAHLEFMLAIENLFDQFYKPYASGVSAPGRNFIFTARFTLVILWQDSLTFGIFPAMQAIDPVIEEGWKKILWDEFQSPYFSELKKFLVEEKKKFTIYPPGNLIFNAFQHTPFDRVKVVILGQDPYHGKGQAHGLCFSVPPGIPTTSFAGQYFQRAAFGPGNPDS